MVEQLRPDDEIHVVAYGSEAEEILPPIRVGDGRRAVRALGEISVGGGTNIEAGLDVAYRAAAARPLRGNDRALVILLSDGVPNGGAFTAEELAPMATRARTTSACTTTVIGLGNQFDPAVLRAVATAGRGEYHVARTAGELGPMLRAELRAQMRVAVRDVRMNVDLPPGVELVHADEESGVERVRGGASLSLPQLRENEERRVVLRVRVQANAGSVARVRLQYRPPVGQTLHASKQLSVRFGARAELSGEMTELALADKDLGRVIDVAANHVLNGRAAQAQAALDAHVQRTEARAGFEANVRLRHRTTAVGRFSRALGALVGAASHTERRELSIAMGGLASRLML